MLTWLADSLQRIAADLPDRLQAAHDLLVRAAVQRPGQRAQGGDDGRVHVGERGGADARGEGRRVHRVVGVQHQACVEDLSGPVGWSAARKLEQEVGGDAKAGIGFRQLAAEPGGVVGGDQHWLLRGQPRGLALVSRRLVGGGVRIIGAAERHQAPQRLHGPLVAGDASQVVGHESAELPASGEFGPVAVQLAAVRGLAALEQERDFLEAGAAGEVVNVVATVEQQPRAAVDVAQRGRSRDYICQTPRRRVRHVPSSPTIRSAVYFRALAFPDLPSSRLDLTRGLHGLCRSWVSPR